MTNRKEIKKAHRKLKMHMMEGGLCIKTTLGSQAGSNEQIVLWREDLGVWSCFGLHEPFWCSYGVGDPRRQDQVNIICQTNMSPAGYNGRLGALFAQNADGVILVHRGKIGGGRRNIGKNGFWKHYRGESVLVSHHGFEEKVALIGPVDSDSFCQYLALFVREIKRIKDELTISS